MWSNFRGDMGIWCVWCLKLLFGLSKPGSDLPYHISLIRKYPQRGSPKLKNETQYKTRISTAPLWQVGFQSQTPVISSQAQQSTCYHARYPQLATTWAIWPSFSAASALPCRSIPSEDICDSEVCHDSSQPMLSPWNSISAKCFFIGLNI